MLWDFVVEYVGVLVFDSLGGGIVMSEFNKILDGIGNFFNNCMKVSVGDIVLIVVEDLGFGWYDCDVGNFF